jgi:hypothetical protein
VRHRHGSIMSTTAHNKPSAQLPAFAMRCAGSRRCSALGLFPLLWACPLAHASCVCLSFLWCLRIGDGPLHCAQASPGARHGRRVWRVALVMEP